MEVSFNKLLRCLRLQLVSLEMKASYFGKTVVNPVRDCNSLVDSYVKQLVIVKLSGFVVTEGGVEYR